MIPTVVTGGVAQLVERLNGIQKVRGSIPLTSTKKSLLKSGDFFLSQAHLSWHPKKNRNESVRVDGPIHSYKKANAFFVQHPEWYTFNAATTTPCPYSISW